MWESLLRQKSRFELLPTAEDLMQEPISINDSSTIYTAAEKILDHNISGVVVKKSDSHQYISQKSIASILLTDHQNIKEIEAAKKSQEMHLVDMLAPISNCANLMLKLRINALGVKDSSGLRGIITKHDLVRYYGENIVDETKLADVMSVGSFFVPHTTTLYDALHKMFDSGVSRLLIKDDSEKPVGIVTYKSFLKNALYWSNRYEDNVFSSGFGRICKIGDIMKREVISVSLNTGLAKIAKILIDYRVHGVAVSRGQKIVGFVTEKDIVRQLARMS